MEPDTGKQSENSARTRGLKPFQPGQSGNPTGRPKGSVSIVKHLREALRRQDEQEARDLADAMIKQAKDSPVAMKLLLDRIDGPVAQQVNVSQLSNEQVIALLTGDVDGGSEEEGA